MGSRSFHMRHTSQFVVPIESTVVMYVLIICSVNLKTHSLPNYVRIFHNGVGFQQATFNTLVTYFQRNWFLNWDIKRVSNVA